MLEDETVFVISFFSPLSEAMRDRNYIIVLIRIEVALAKRPIAMMPRVKPKLDMQKIVEKVREASIII